MLYLRIAAVACTGLFAALLVWLYGVETTIVWAGAMTAFLLLLWVVTTPLRARQRRVWLEMGLGRDGRPLPEVEEVEPVDDPGPGPEDPGTPGAGR